MLSETARSRDGHVCNSCITEKSFKRCGKCGYLYAGSSDVVNIGSIGHKAGVCPTCYRDANECEYCGKTINDVHNVWHTTRKVCSSCITAGMKAANCTGCGHITDQFITLLTNRATFKFCPSCTRQIKEAL